MACPKSVVFSHPLSGIGLDTEYRIPKTLPLLPWLLLVDHVKVHRWHHHTQSCNVLVQVFTAQASKRVLPTFFSDQAAAGK